MLFCAETAGNPQGSLKFDSMTLPVVEGKAMTIEAGIASNAEASCGIKTTTQQAHRWLRRVLLHTSV